MTLRLVSIPRTLCTILALVAGSSGQHTIGAAKSDTILSSASMDGRVLDYLENVSGSLHPFSLSSHQNAG